MNGLISPRLVRQLTLVILSLVLLHLVAAAALAADASGASDSMQVLQGNFIYELVGNRSRMIQISLIFVALGCALIWWYR
jgi:hypothetical protein